MQKNGIYIMKKTKLLISLMTLSTLLSQGAKAEKLPESVINFQGLNFDERSELKADLMQRTGFKFPSELMGKVNENESIDFQRKCSDIITFGCSLSSIDTQTNDVGRVAKLCGFHRLAEFYDFKKEKKNKGKFFLDSKDPLYASAITQEMFEFDEASSRLDIWDFLFLKKNLMFEGWRFQKEHPNYHSLYQNHIIQKTKERYLGNKKIRQSKAR